MAWSYSGNPAASAQDEVRFLVGDTDTADQQISDEEIAYALAETGNVVYDAAAMVARAIAAKWAKKADKSVGGLSINYSQKHDRYVGLAEALAEEAATGAGRLVGVPRLGGGGQTYLGNEWT